VFEINPEGKLTTPYAFCSRTNCTDGESPEWFDTSEQQFYGTPPLAGLTIDGTVFEITLRAS
jgi:hypothetical protein